MWQVGCRRTHPIATLATIPSVILPKTVHQLTNLYQKALIVVLNALLLAACSAPVDEPPPAANASLSWQATSSNGTFDVRIEPVDGRTPIGEFHQWEIVVLDQQGNGIHPARITMSGGMPSHGHGLPTQPQVTDHLGGGRYRIEGVRFNMAGAWLLEFGIESAGGRDRVRFDVELMF